MPHASRALALSFVALLSAGAAAQSSQTLPAGFDNAQGGSGTSFPFNSTASHKWQWHYDSSNFTQGSPIRITEIYVRALSASQTVNAFDYPSMTVTCSQAITDYTVAGHDPVFANNLGPNTVVVRTGPWTGGPVAPNGSATAPWIAFGLTTPFDYDPTTGDDLIIQIETCGPIASFGGSLDGKTGGVGVNGGNRYGSTSDCAALASTFSNNEFVPVVRIDYLGVSSTPTSYCTSGVTSSSCAPIIGYTGTPSASAQGGFSLDITSVEGQRQGLIFYGLDNTGFTPTPWGTSFFCVKPPLQRTGVQMSGGTVGQCDGVLSIDWNAYRTTHGAALGQPMLAGQRVLAQAWFQDPLGVKSTAFSNALEFFLAP